MDKVVVISANTGKFDKESEFIAQSIPVDFYRFTDENFPPRFNSMTPRLQARIPKCFGWQLALDYDYYIWIDSSMRIISPDAVKWLLERLGGSEMVFFKHPDRNSIKEEYEFVKEKIKKNNYYLTPRYKNEFNKEQIDEIYSDKGFKDDLLIASTMFAYKNTDKVRNALKDWWYHISRYTTQDQYNLPYVLYKHKIDFNLIEEHYMHTKYFEYWRNK